MRGSRRRLGNSHNPPWQMRASSSAGGEPCFFFCWGAVSLHKRSLGHPAKTPSCPVPSQLHRGSNNVPDAPAAPADGVPPELSSVARNLYERQESLHHIADLCVAGSPGHADRSRRPRPAREFQKPPRRPDVRVRNSRIRFAVLPFNLLFEMSMYFSACRWKHVNPDIEIDIPMQT